MKRMTAMIALLVMVLVPVLWTAEAWARAGGGSSGGSRGSRGLSTPSSPAPMSPTRPSMKRRTKAPSAHERFGVGSGGATQFVSTGTIGSVPSGMRKCAGTDTSSQNSRSWLTARSKPASSPVASRAFPQSDAPGTWRSGILRKPAAPRGAQCLSPTPTQYAGRLS